MRNEDHMSRRGFFKGLAGLAGAVAVSGCVNGPAMRLATGVVAHRGVGAMINYDAKGEATSPNYIVIKRWDDKNKDRDIKDKDKNELLGDVDDSVNISNIGIFFCLSGSYGTPVRYSILDSDDNVLAQRTSSTGLVCHKEGMAAGEYTFAAGAISRKLIIKR
jgi:hypothetical protein